MQWKKIDISIWFEIDGVEQLIVIEDKVGSSIHYKQLERYFEEINCHNNYWREKEKQKKHILEKYVKEEGNVFKIFYKNNVIDEWESKYIKKLGWKIYDINLLYELFKDVETENNILSDYKEYITNSYFSSIRKQPPSEWDLISWHAFFNEYKRSECISNESEMGCYQNEYYYMKFFVKDHEKDYPCFEIRSRDFSFDNINGKCSLIIRVVLYNLEKQPNIENINQWQSMLKMRGFNLNHRKDITKLKQIGTIEIRNFENSEIGLINVFNDVSTLLSEIF